MGHATNEIIDKAIVFATERHAGAVRKGTGRPYILHPLEAAVIVETMTEDAEVIAAAVLHDVMEDAGVTYAELAQKLGPRVADLVSVESENKRTDRPAESTWKIRKSETLERLKDAPIEEKMITLGDKLSNIKAIYRDQAELGDALWSRFNCKDKSEHEWYYRSIAERTKELDGTLAWQEYIAYLDNVFAENYC
jgi:Guanosine polyphosphate pyrophosphohydrolases/synthetases